MDNGKQEIRIVCTGQVMRAVDELTPYAQNARIHGDAQIEALRKSLRRLGFVRPLLVDRDGNLIAGHGTLMAAKAEGMTQVPCILVEGLSDEERRAYILADNRLAEMSAWDIEMLDTELKSLDLPEIGLDGLDFSDLLPNEGGIMGLDLDGEEPQEEGAKDTTYICPKCGFSFHV